MHPAQIPLTPQTDERNFPRWEGEKATPGKSGARYPKMLTRKFTKEEREPWLEKHKRHDRVDGDYWEERCPKVGDPVAMEVTQDLVDAGLADVIGEPIIVQTPEDEKLVLRTLGLDVSEPKEAATVSIPLAASRVVADEENREQDAMDELEAENARLRKQLAAFGKPAKRKYTKRKDKEKRLTLAEMSEAE